MLTFMSRFAIVSLWVPFLTAFPYLFSLDKVGLYPRSPLKPLDWSSRGFFFYIHLLFLLNGCKFINERLEYRRVDGVFLRHYLSISNQSVLQTSSMSLDGLRGRIHRPCLHPQASLVDLNGYHTRYTGLGWLAYCVSSEH